MRTSCTNSCLKFFSVSLFDTGLSNLIIATVGLQAAEFCFKRYMAAYYSVMASQTISKLIFALGKKGSVEDKVKIN